jgi:hypothetical protein
MNSFKLITETVDPENFEFLVEQKNTNEEPKMYVRGPFIMMNEKNHNNRVYSESEMSPSVDEYIKEFVDKGRALNELNHPAEPDVNLERACDKTVSLVREGNFYIGKAICLSTPMGKLQQSLIRDGVKFGKSTRCLGQLQEKNGVNYVVGPKIRAIDTVWNPSGQGKDTSCFVDGILENKEFIVKSNNKFEELYSNFENAINKLPRKDIDNYLAEQIITFINSIK